MAIIKCPTCGSAQRENEIDMFGLMAKVGKKAERATEEEKKEKSNIFNPCL